MGVEGEGVSFNISPADCDRRSWTLSTSPSWFSSFRSKHLKKKIKLSLKLGKAERAAVAFNKFLWNKDGSLESPSAAQSQRFRESLANITSSNINLTTRFAATDLALEAVKTWPQKLEFDEQSWPGDFFKSKLSFQIKHGVFRSNLKTGEKTIFEVLKWKVKYFLRVFV